MDVEADRPGREGRDERRKQARERRSIGMRLPWTDPRPAANEATPMLDSGARILRNDGLEESMDERPQSLGAA